MIPQHQAGTGPSRTAAARAGTHRPAAVWCVASGAVCAVANMTTIEAIRRCIDDCAKARDDRGRWRQQRNCAQQLEQLGTTPSIAAMTAAAARTIGATIARLGVK